LHTLRAGQAGSVGCTVVSLPRKADGEKREGPHRTLASPSRDGEARIEISRPRWACRECGASCIEDVPFRASGQRITLPLLAFVCDLLTLGQTLKAMSPTAGLPRNVVKKIERARLSGLYTEGEGSKRKLRKPERQGRYLGADTFKLHGGHRCATVIVDLKMGHVLWLVHSKGGLAF